MSSDELIKLSFAAIGAVVGYLIKDFLDRRRDLDARRVSDRREHYRNLILAMKSLAEGSRQHTDLIRFEHAFLWLYAPDAVVRAANRLLRQLRDPGEQLGGLESLAGELVLEMRRDLGFRKTALVSSDFSVDSVSEATTDA